MIHLYSLEKVKQLRGLVDRLLSYEQRGALRATSELGSNKRTCVIMGFKTASQRHSSNRTSPTSARRTSSTRSRPPGFDLQTAIGNSATSRLLATNRFQGKLRSKTPGDPVQHEANRAAGEVMRMSEQSKGPTSAVAFGGGPNLHGRADAVFDGGKKKISNVKTTRATGCDCATSQLCMKATGTLEITYKVTVKITMPPMPKGLSKCKQDRVTAFFKNVLGPHEQKHKDGYETYSGTTKHSVEGLGCGKDGAKSDLDDEARRIFDDEAAAREKKANDESDHWDPFYEMVDYDGCK